MYIRPSKLSRRKRGSKNFFLLSVLLATVILCTAFKLTHRRSPLQVSVRIQKLASEHRHQQQEYNDDLVVVINDEKVQTKANSGEAETSSMLKAVTSSIAPVTKRAEPINGNTWFQNPIYRCRNNPPFLLVLIASQGESFEERKVVRETWCKDRVFSKGRNVQCIFMVGRDIHNTNLTEEIVEESMLNRDIIMKAFDDTFRNSSRKLVMGLSWAEDFCPQASYVMKTEDDVIVNLKVVVNELLPNSPKQKFATGRCWSDIPNRNPESKYYVSTELYPQEKFPAYCSTNGFIMSADVMRAMNHIHSTNTSKLLPLDDVYAGVLWQHIGLEPIDNTNFIVGKYDTSMACEYSKHSVIIHTHIHDMGKMWKSMTSCITS